MALFYIFSNSSTWIWNGNGIEIGGIEFGYYGTQMEIWSDDYWSSLGSNAFITYDLFICLRIYWLWFDFHRLTFTNIVQYSNFSAEYL